MDIHQRSKSRRFLARGLFLLYRSWHEFHIALQVPYTGDRTLCLLLCHVSFDLHRLLQDTCQQKDVRSAHPQMYRPVVLDQEGRNLLVRGLLGNDVRTQHTRHQSSPADAGFLHPCPRNQRRRHANRILVTRGGWTGQSAERERRHSQQRTADEKISGVQQTATACHGGDCCQPPHASGQLLRCAIQQGDL